MPVEEFVTKLEGVTDDLLRIVNILVLFALWIHIWAKEKNNE